MKTYAIKYVELGERHAEKMAKRWALDVQNNIHTKKYKELPEDEIIRQSLKFYQHFSKMFLDEKIKENTSLRNEINRLRSIIKKNQVLN